MSKVTPSALRGLSVAAGTVGLAAAGAAAMAGQACAASSVTSGLAGGGLPVSTNAVPAVLGAVAHNHGTIAGIPISSLPVLSDLQSAMSDAAPAPDALPGLGYADLGELPVTRSRPVPGAQSGQGAYVPRHAVPAAAPHAAPAATPAPEAPAPSFPPASGTMPQVPGPTPAQVAAAAKAAQSGPLDNVTNALHGLPIAGSLTGNLPLGGLGGLTGGLAGLGG